MKKLLTMVAAATCMAVQTYGQGTVTFAALNISNVLTGMKAEIGTTFAVALYWLPDSATAPVTGDFGSQNLAAVTNMVSAGGGNFGIVRIDGITPSGAPAWFQLRAWENVLGVGTTWEQAMVTPSPQGRPALAGTSNIGKIDTGDPTTVPPGTAPNTALTLKGFVMVPVPEPSVIGLGVLGLGALLLLRRRQ
jgi:hypothetical protein